MRQEVEAWGVTYERYALGKLQQKLVDELRINRVAELPAHGAKAMPSIYSIGFGSAGADVTLVNGKEDYRLCWQKLGIKDKAKFTKVKDITQTGLEKDSYDLVWNFAYLPISKSPDGLIKEMKRISKKYVACFSVNFGNVGFHIHRFLHWWTGIPWTHGKVELNRISNIASLMNRHGLKVVKTGYVDTPFWPDSLGFRDMRLHRNNIKFDNVAWESPYIDYLADGSVPLWMELVYLWESIPMFSYLKTLYSHINFVIAEKSQ